MEDLEYILREKTILKGEQPFSVFWDEFCESDNMRAAVLAISKHQPVQKTDPNVRRLLDYGYIVPNEQEEYRMRVPLFEQWVLQHGY